MGDTDVNVYVTTGQTHAMGGALVDKGGLSVRIHLGSQSIDQTLMIGPPLAAAIRRVAEAPGPDLWPGPWGANVACDLDALHEVMLRHPSWFGLSQTLGMALTRSALRSLVIGLRFPHG